MVDERFNQRGRKINAFNYVIQAELTKGSQFLVADPGGQLYAVVDDEGTTRVLQLSRAGRGGERWFSYFHSTYGIGEREEYNSFIYDALRSHVIKHGTRVELRRFSAYNQFTQTGYISAYNGRMYKIDGEDISDIAIGEDGVFFIDDDPGVHCMPDIGDHGIFLDRLINTINFVETGLSGITPEQQKKAFMIWLFALAFPDLMPTKPILLVEGAFGSGKTSVVTFLQLALAGVENSMILQRNKEDDFGVVLLRSPIALFDNTDSYIEWVPDAIAAYTTIGKWTKRKLFTDDENMIIKPHAFIAVASRNPSSFRREDVADRCVILRLERRKTFGSVSQIKARILADRPQLLGEYLYYVGKIIVELRAMRGQPQIEERYRMADFASFGRVVGRVFGWADEDLASVMEALQGERDAFANEEDPMIDIMRKWIAYKPQGRSSEGRAVSAFQLHAELEALASIGHSHIWKDTPRTLVQKLRSTQIEREFRIERSVVGGQQMFKIWRASSAQLALVEDDEIPLIEEA